MIKLIFVVLCVSSVTHGAPLFLESTSSTVNCGEIGDCLSVAQNCTETCGCDNFYYFEKSTNECLLNKTYLKQLMIEKYNTEEKIQQDAQNVFKGVLISVFIFMVCASFCALSACVYCCHVSYSDQKLNKDVNALAKKLHRNGTYKKVEKKEIEDKAQSCNVVVEDAGVFVC